MGWLKPKPLPPWVDADQLDGRLEAALRGHDSQALDAFIREVFSEGMDEGEILGFLEKFHRRLRQQDREPDEDRVMDLMDRLVGWCAPHAILRKETRPDESS